MDFFERRRHHRPRPAARVAINFVNVTINLEFRTMQVNLTWTTPVLRADGTTALPLSEIQATNVRRNGTIIAAPVAISGTMAFSDTTPLTGTDVYTVETVTTDGLVSAPSNEATITVTAANPAAAITDLVGTLVTP